MGLSDFDVSAKMRDLITKIAETAVNKMRPEYRYGKCLSIDYQKRRALVLMNGDIDGVTVPITHVWPHEGQTVRVAGNGTDRFIDAAIGGPLPLSFQVASSQAEERSFVDSHKPSREHPLLVYRKDRSFLAGEFRFTVDGMMWREFSTYGAGIAWQVPTFQNGFSDYLSNFATRGYGKLEAGIVVVGGLIKGSGVNQVIFNLPEGYRPDERMVFYSTTDTAAVARVDVMPDGDVIARVNNGGWLALDGIMFPAAGVADWQPITLVNGWTEYTDVAGTGYGIPAWWQDELGRIWLRGMVKRDGTVPTSDSIIGLLPPEIDPNWQLHFGVLVGSNVDGAIDIQKKNGLGGDANYPVIRWKRKGSGTNSTTWVSLAGIMYTPASHEAMTTIPYDGTWVSSDPSRQPPQSYQLHRDGMVQLQGLIQGGNINSNATSGILPVGARPDMRRLFPMSRFNALGRVDVLPTGQIIQYAGTASFSTLNGINYLVGL